MTRLVYLLELKFVNVRNWTKMQGMYVCVCECEQNQGEISGSGSASCSLTCSDRRPICFVFIEYTSVPDSGNSPLLHSQKVQRGWGQEIERKRMCERKEHFPFRSPTRLSIVIQAD